MTLLRGLTLLLAIVACQCTAVCEDIDQTPQVFRAGAAAVEVTPTHFPVIVNGSFRENTATRAYGRLMSRAVVLDDGQVQLAIVVVDSLMIPRNLLDIAKQAAHEATGIATERMLISATHTHSAPSAMGCLGSRADAEYSQFLVGQIATSIQHAAQNLEVAKVGWAVVKDYEHNHCRRWVFRPDRMATDPFGMPTVRAHMHPGHESPGHIGPAGPADPDLSLLSIQTIEGRPMAVLANYAMHYYGTSPVSADFCGRFGKQLSELIGIESEDSRFVGIMSQGTSGDSMWMDYSKPAPQRDIDRYTNEVARVAHGAYQSIAYRNWASLAMAEKTLRLKRRVPDRSRLEWARSVLKDLGDRLPQSQPEIYAREQVYLDEEPEVEIKLQAIRIGDLGITAIPNEVYGITGLKLKRQSPLQPTFNIELANGAQGYIPPPEQHKLGGYTTWPARTAGLEVEAEPKIVEHLLDLLEQVAEKPQRTLAAKSSAYATSVTEAKPTAYWRLSEMSGTLAMDAMGKSVGTYEPGVAFYLPGFDAASTRSHHAAHFAGGRVHADVDGLGETYSIELWIWNGLPTDVRPVTGYFFSRGTPGASDGVGDHLGIGGTHMDSAAAGKLIVYGGNGQQPWLVGSTVIPQRSWNHIVFVRDGRQVRVYLNGRSTPEINANATHTVPADVNDFFIGGRCDRFAPFEGKISDVAIYSRALGVDEISEHFACSGVRDSTSPTEIPAAAVAPQSRDAKSEETEGDR